MDPSRQQDGWRDDITLFRPAACAWSSVKQGHMPRARGYGAAASLPGAFYFLGGGDNAGFTDEVCRFDMAQGRWSYVRPLHSPLSDCPLIPLLFYNCTGYNGSRHAATFLSCYWRWPASIAEPTRGNCPTVSCWQPGHPLFLHCLTQRRTPCRGRRCQSRGAALQLSRWTARSMPLGAAWECKSRQPSTTCSHDLI